MPGEPHTFWDRVVEKAASALASGALQPIETRSVTLVDGGVRFLTRVAANLVRKQVAGKKRGPGFNPFLSPEEDLLIGCISRILLTPIGRIGTTFESRNLLPCGTVRALGPACALDAIGCTRRGRIWLGRLAHPNASLDGASSVAFLESCSLPP